MTNQTTTDSHQLTMNSLLQRLGVDEMTAEEQAALFDEIGTLVFDAALLRFFDEQDESTTEAFADFLEAQAEGDEVLVKLFEHFPAFAEIFEAEATVLRSDLEQVLPPTTGA